MLTRDVLVIDKAGIVGTRQLERVLPHAARRRNIIHWIICLIASTDSLE